ncbi:MAG: MBOAT family protein, partial [Eubacterium sp.]|nr:MBOAT family protein [Eubacterium sp.]
MVFSSLVFISIFLPAVLLTYWLLPSVTGRNVLLLAVSLLFYAYGEPVYVFLMIASSLFHYICALWICRCRTHGRTILAVVVLTNLALLCIFKYAAFLTSL